MIVELLVLALATARLCRLIIEDDLLDKPRTYLLSRWPSSDVSFGDSEVSRETSDVIGYDIGRNRHGVEVFYADGVWVPTETVAVAKLLTCVWCLSFWVGLALWIGYVFYPDPVFYGSVPFAISYVVGRWS